jgi:hypothetical protein
MTETPTRQIKRTWNPCHNFESDIESRDGAPNINTTERWHQFAQHLAGCEHTGFNTMGALNQYLTAKQASSIAEMAELILSFAVDNLLPPS